MSSQRKIVVCGITTCPPSMIVAYIFNKVFPDTKFQFSEEFKIYIEPDTDYVFIHKPPTVTEVNEMKTKNSNAVIITESQAVHLKDLSNVLWILGNNMIEEVFKTFASANLGPVTASKIKRIQEDDQNFKLVLEMLLTGLADNEEDIERNLPNIFNQFDELFSLRPDEFDTIAKYLDMHDDQFINNNVEHATMSVDDEGEETYDAVVCETNRLSILNKLVQKYAKEVDIVVATHSHFRDGKHCVTGTYREGLNIEYLKKIKGIEIDEKNRKFHFVTNDIDYYFGNDCSDEDE